MSEAFAPRTDTNIAFERPIAPVESAPPDQSGRVLLEGFGNLLRTATSAVGTSGGGSGGSSSDALTSNFVELMAQNQQLREQGKTTVASLNERTLVANYSSAGGSLDASTKAAVESVTGRPFDYVGQTEDQRQLTEARESPIYQSAYMAGRAQLGADATEQQLDQYAITRVGEQAIATDTIARIQAGQQVNWEMQGQGAFSATIDTFHQSTLGGLAMITERGGMLTPNDVLEAKQQWGQLKASFLSRPDGVSDDQWKNIQARVDATDTLFTTLDKLGSSEQAIEQLTSVYVQSFGPSSEMSPDQLLAALAVAKDPNAFINNAGMLLQEELVTLGNLSAENRAADAESRLVDTATAATPLGGITADTIITDNPDEFKQYTNISPEQRVRDMEANNILVGSITPDLISNPDSAAQFADALQGNGVVLMNTKEFLSPGMLNKLVGSKNIKANLEALDLVDPEAATEARILIRSGLNVQRAAQEENLNSIEEGARIGGYELNIEFDPDTNTYYTNSAEFIRFQTQRRGAGEVSQATVEGKGYRLGLNDDWINDDIKSAYDRRKALVVINKSMGDLRDPAAVVAEEARASLATTPAPQAQEVISNFEGFKTTAYWDVNAWRTGYGSDTVTLADGTIQKVTKDTVVTQEDAQRDLERRTAEFADTAKRNVGEVAWNGLGDNIKSALTSVAYNYGSLPTRIRPAVQSGDVEAIAKAVEGLADDNDGVNSKRRLAEAAIIRGNYAPGGVPQVNTTPLSAETPSSAPTESPRPQARSSSSAPVDSLRPQARPEVTGATQTAEDILPTTEAPAAPTNGAERSEVRKERIRVDAEVEALVEALSGQPDTESPGAKSALMKSYEAMGTNQAGIVEVLQEYDEKYGAGAAARVISGDNE